MENILNPTGSNVARRFDSARKNSFVNSNLFLGLISVVVVSLGITTGYYFSGVGKNPSENRNISANLQTGENEAGVADASTFPDTTEGVLEEGGINGEGTHHLVRGSGPSQYAYLTSTVINLDNFVGKKVQVWGQTISGKKAGWLMDVGKIKVIE